MTNLRVSGKSSITRSGGTKWGRELTGHNSSYLLKVNFFTKKSKIKLYLNDDFTIMSLILSEVKHA